MRARYAWLTGACATAAVIATRWPVRSRAFFGWDSANFALALERIDIGAHRPHPPGYLAYVLAGRLFAPFVANPNTGFIIWNLIATTVSVVVLVRFATDLDEHEGRRSATPLFAGLALVTSPLFWFYGTITEIYPSELMVTLLVAYAAWHAIRGHSTAIYWCIAALGCAALFKASAAVLMTPLALDALWHQPRERRIRAAIALAVVASGVLAIFLTLQPDIFSLVSGQFNEASAPSRVVAGATNPGRALNRNLRDTTLSMTAALGVFNAGVLLVWAVAIRRLPSGLSRRFVLVWILPQTILLLAIHIGRPGYVLPLLPIAALTAASAYSRWPRRSAWALASLAAFLNVGQFVLLRPPSSEARGGNRPYREKTALQRALSDLEPLAWPTRFSVRQSDDRVNHLLTTVATSCPSGDQVIVAGAESVDWRRVMWYVPGAIAIRIEDDGQTVVAIARNRESSAPTAEARWTSSCPVVWLTANEQEPPVVAGSQVVPLPGLGWTSPPAVLDAPGGMLRVLP